MGKNPEAIVAWQRMGPRLTTSGKLAPADLDCLAQIGVTRVINLALADSPGILADEAERLEALGIAYTHIPVPFEAPEEMHFTAFSAAMIEGGGETIHVHCVANWRVAAFVYRWNHEVLGMDEADARALMAHQWTPETSTHKDAPAWARFIAGE